MNDRTMAQMILDIENLTPEQREILVNFFSIKYFERTGEFLEVQVETE